MIPLLTFCNIDFLPPCEKVPVPEPSTATVSNSSVEDVSLVGAAGGTAIDTKGAVFKPPTTNASVGGFGIHNGSTVQVSPARRSSFHQGGENTTSDPDNATDEAERLEGPTLPFASDPFVTDVVSSELFVLLHLRWYFDSASTTANGLVTFHFSNNYFSFTLYHYKYKGDDVTSFSTLISINAGCSVKFEDEDGVRRCVLGELSIIKYKSGQCFIKLVERGNLKIKMHQVLVSNIQFMVGSNTDLAWIAMDNVDSSGMTTSSVRKATVNVFVKGTRADEDARKFKEKAQEVFFSEPATSTAEDVVEDEGEDAKMEVINVMDIFFLSRFGHIPA